MNRISEQDLRPMARETAAHHEECLEACLQDIRNHVSLVPNRDPEDAFRWPVLHAQKHYNALLDLPGYVMPEYLAQMYGDVMGDD